MNLIDNVKNEELQNIRFVLTDMDETLTYKGRLQARTYQSLEMLQHAGIKVIPVTAASAGWADQMARMWPVDGVIAENGGLFLPEITSNMVLTGTSGMKTNIFSIEKNQPYSSQDSPEIPLG